MLARRVSGVGAGRVGVLAVVALVLGVVSAQAALASQADGPAMVVTPNWSGYVATGQQGSPVKYTSVTGTWTVPNATCNTPASASGISTVWVGLGGYTTKNQEEVGTDSNCSAKNKPTYFAWFELVPYIAYHVPTSNKVLPGDTMTGLVKILSPTLVMLQIQNQTRNWIFSRNITFSTQDTSTAEWISEAPAACVYWVCHEANLANFGTVTMRNISAVGDGQTGTLSNPDWAVTALQLVPTKLSVPTLNPDASTPPKSAASSPAGATPGAFSPDGSTFSIQWIAVANRGL